MIEYGYMMSEHYSEHYDGISEYNCKKCGYRQGRWTGNELKDGELELVFGYIKKPSKYIVCSECGEKGINEDDNVCLNCGSKKTKRIYK